MTDINCVIVVGRITRDVGTDERSFGYSSNGKARANFTIATNRSYKNPEQEIVEEVCFLDVVVWGKMAESLKPYLTKGKQVCVEGYLRQNKWEKDGQKFSKINIVATSVQLLGGRGDGSGSSKYSGQYSGGQGGSGGYNTQYQSGMQQMEGTQTQEATSSFEPKESTIPDDIPF